MAPTALLELRLPMSDGAHDRDSGPGPSADESHSATSSFDLVVRANRGEGPALDALLARYLPRSVSDGRTASCLRRHGGRCRPRTSSRTPLMHVLDEVLR